MNRIAVIAMVIATTALAGGCQRFNYGGSGPAPAPLPAVPAQPVDEGGALQPLVLDDGRQTPPPYDPNAPYDPNSPADPALAGNGQPDETQPAASADGNTQVAAVQPQGEAVGRTDLLGGWTVTANGQSCKLFMNLTTWKGGYRATTRGCAAGALGQISAWDLNGTQVLFKDQAGSELARLYKSAPERFNGQTAGGQAISFYR